MKTEVFFMPKQNTQEWSAIVWINPARKERENSKISMFMCRSINKVRSFNISVVVLAEFKLKTRHTDLSIKALLPWR